MNRTLILLAALGIALAASPGLEAQAAGGPGQGAGGDPEQGPGDRRTTQPDQREQDRQRLEARRRQIRHNLEAWKRLSDEEKQAVRQRILEFLRRAHAEGGRDRPQGGEHEGADGHARPGGYARPGGGDQHPPDGLRGLLERERHRLRERHAEFERHFREHARERRDSMPEGIEELDPLARKRYFYLRRILKGLTKEQRAELAALPDDERPGATKKLLSTHGSRLFTAELERVSPAAAKRYGELEPRQARRVFRAWLETPSPGLSSFLREHELLLPGDPPGRRRGGQRFRGRGGPGGRGDGPPGGPPWERERRGRDRRGHGDRPHGDAPHGDAPKDDAPKDHPEDDDSV